MCGLAGAVGAVGAAAALERVGWAMGEALRRRGPDDGGVWTDEAAGVLIAHRRLAVLELSPAGAQPMVSACGRLVLAYNGEIYNHLDLRRALEDEGAGVDWRGRSDTETLLAAILAWGVEATLRRAVGMFALALWDRRARRLTLARDRLGEKPLYYGRQGGAFLFGSELSALRAYPGFVGEVDPDAVAAVIKHHYVPAPASIYRGVRKLPPGMMLELDVDAAEPTPRPYWSVAQAARQGAVAPFDGDEEAAADTLEALLSRAVAGQTLSDVPIGAFLSGGIDSSLIVALMQAQASRPVKTFTIGFEAAGFDEAAHARAVAAHLGTDHVEHYVTVREAQDVAPRLPELYCEPFADASQIPAFLIAQAARREVTVCLSGDGGDELFGGYQRYDMDGTKAAALLATPLPLRRAAAWGVRRLAAAEAGGARLAAFADKAEKLTALLSSRSDAELRGNLVSHLADPAALTLGGRATPLGAWGEAPEPAGFQAGLMAFDMMTYLPDDVMVKVDRAAMAVSLETRAPFLDHRLVEFSQSLPLSMKLRGGVRKRLLRQLLYRHAPAALVDRPKMGFRAPIGAWLRGALRDWAEDLLSPRRLAEGGLFRPEAVRALWRRHLVEGRPCQYQLWPVLMVQAWLAAGG